MESPNKMARERAITENGVQPASVVQSSQTTEQQQQQLKKNERSVRCYKLLLTLAVDASYAMVGLGYGLVSSTLPDLKNRLGCSTSQLNVAFAFKLIGAILGAVLGGIIHDRIPGSSHPLLVTSLATAGVSVICLPWSPSVSLVWVLGFTEGAGYGCIDTVGSPLLVNLWGEQSDAALHSMNFGYVVGNTLAPVITAPFLSPDTSENPNCLGELHENTTHCENATNPSPTGSPVGDDSRMEIPYAIAGSLSLLLMFVFLTFTVVQAPAGLTMHHPQKTNLREVFSPGSCSAGRPVLGVLMVVLMVLFCILMLAQGMGPWTLIFTYAVESPRIHMSKQEAAKLDFAQRGSALVSQALIIPLSRWLNSSVIIFATVIGTTISMILIAFVGVQSKLAFWITTCLYHFMGSQSVAWAAGLAFVDKYIIMYAFLVSLAYVGIGVSGFAFQSLYGYMYESSIPESMYYLSSALSCLWTLVLVAMQLVGCRLGNRHKHKSEDFIIHVEEDNNRGDSAHVNEALSTPVEVAENNNGKANLGGCFESETPENWLQHNHDNTVTRL